jgi:hypothetical protein
MAKDTNSKGSRFDRAVADCFKFRNKVGLDTAVEAVRFYR